MVQEPWKAGFSSEPLFVALLSTLIHLSHKGSRNLLEERFCKMPGTCSFCLDNLCMGGPGKMLSCTRRKGSRKIFRTFFTLIVLQDRVLIWALASWKWNFRLMQSHFEGSWQASYYAQVGLCISRWDLWNKTLKAPKDFLKNVPLVTSISSCL